MSKLFFLIMALLIGFQASASLIQVGMISVFVEEYEEAKNWYVEKLGLEVKRDSSFPGGMRFLTVQVPGQCNLEIVLYRGQPLVGDFGIMTIYSDNIREDVSMLKSKGVEFSRDVTSAPYGYNAVLKDLYGQSIVLIQLNNPVLPPNSNCLH